MGQDAPPLALVPDKDAGSPLHLAERLSLVLTPDTPREVTTAVSPYTRMCKSSEVHHVVTQRARFTRARKVACVADARRRNR